MAEQIKTEIQDFTNRFIEQHGQAAFDLLEIIAGISSKSLDHYQQGKRAPDRFMLYFVWKECPNHPLGQWALTCLEIRAKHGEGLPLGCRGLK